MVKKVLKVRMIKQILTIILKSIKQKVMRMNLPTEAGAGACWPVEAKMK
jgi:hypothetical protein